MAWRTTDEHGDHLTVHTERRAQVVFVVQSEAAKTALAVYADADDVSQLIGVLDEWLVGARLRAADEKRWRKIVEEQP